MRTLKRLYKAGVIVKRAKCSNHSLVPFRITYTETVDKPITDIMRTWFDMLLDGDPPEVDTGL